MGGRWERGLGPCTGQGGGEESEAILDIGVCPLPAHPHPAWSTDENTVLGGSREEGQGSEVWKLES